MSLTGKKTRDPSHLPTLSYEIKLNLPVSVDSKPQEISFLDLIANDSKFVSRIYLSQTKSHYLFSRKTIKKVWS